MAANFRFLLWLFQHELETALPKDKQTKFAVLARVHKDEAEKESMEATESALEKNICDVRDKRMVTMTT